MAGLWVGTSGFSYPEWRPAFYPDGLPARNFLRHYATRLNSVEIDSAFYRMPLPATLETWRNAVGDAFRICLKAPRRITHVERLRLPSPTLDLLLERLPLLGSRLGPVLVQLPPNFRSDFARLDAFLAVLARNARAAVEFRHPSWFVPETYDVLRAHACALCVADTDEGTSPIELTAPFVYLRLRRSSFDPAPWRRRMRLWQADGLDVHAYVKHRDNPRAPLVAEGLGGAAAPVPRRRTPP